jgi:hypothetical protein
MSNQNSGQQRPLTLQNYTNTNSTHNVTVFSISTFQRRTGTSKTKKEEGKTPSQIANF